MCWLGWARAGPYQGGGDPGVETQQAHVLLHGAVYHQPQFPSDLPHQLPVDCEDRRTVWALQATCQLRPQPSSSSPLCAARPPSGIFRAPCLRLAQPGLTHALACGGHGGAPGLGGKEDPARTEACLSPQAAWWGWKKGIQPRDQHVHRKHVRCSTAVGSKETSGWQSQNSQAHLPLTGHLPCPQLSEPMNE